MANSDAGVPVPVDVEDRIARGAARLKQLAPERTECLRFWRGDQYGYRNSSGVLVSGNTLVGDSGRPQHRPRGAHNILTDIVRQEVSAATSRVPGYEINPSTNDSDDMYAAKLAGKVARFGYDKWNMQDAMERAVTLAVVADEAFIWPYWDTTVGPFLDKEGTGMGEVCLRVFSGNEVFWESGIRFEESPWWCVQQARTIHEIKRMPGFLGGGDLSPDATNSEAVGDARENGGNQKLVLVREYLERPCPDYPQGRRVVIANNRVICKPEGYPCIGPDGAVLDEPVLHKLAYILDPANDRDMGLVRHCLDPLRTYNDCWNRQIQWKQLALNPQFIVKNGKLAEKRTDEPGKIYHFFGSGGVEVINPPPIPRDLEDMKQAALAEIGRIVAQNAIPSQIEAGKAIAALVERDSGARQSFTARLATFHSRLMRACLSLVALYYTEPRLLSIRGWSGPELIEGFKGANLRSQVDVTVLPGSITPFTREQIQAKLTWIASTFPGYLSPEVAISALDGGTAEGLIQRFELDRARANSVIQKIKAGPENFLNAPEVQAPAVYGLPPGSTVPNWMPRPFDNLPVHKQTMEDFLKTMEYDMAEPPVQEAANLVYQGLEWLEQQKAQAAAMQQTMMAEQLGAANAAKPQSGSEMPDMPGGSTPQPDTPMPQAA